MILVIFVGSLAFLPAWLLDSAVMPQLMSLKSAYGNAEATASQAAGQDTSQ